MDIPVLVSQSKGESTVLDIWVAKYVNCLGIQEWRQVHVGPSLRKPCCDYQWRDYLNCNFKGQNHSTLNKHIRAQEFWTTCILSMRDVLGSWWQSSLESPWNCFFFSSFKLSEHGSLCSTREQHRAGRQFSVVNKMHIRVKQNKMF